MHRMTFLILSVDRYDLEQLFSYLGYVLEASRKFCQPTQTSTSHSMKPLFFLEMCVTSFLRVVRSLICGLSR